MKGSMVAQTLLCEPTDTSNTEDWHSFPHAVILFDFVFVFVLFVHIHGRPLGWNLSDQI